MYVAVLIKLVNSILTCVDKLDNALKSRPYSSGTSLYIENCLLFQFSFYWFGDDCDKVLYLSDDFNLLFIENHVIKTDILPRHQNFPPVKICTVEPKYKLNLISLVT